MLHNKNVFFALHETINYIWSQPRAFTDSERQKFDISLKEITLFERIVIYLLVKNRDKLAV